VSRRDGNQQAPSRARASLWGLSLASVSMWGLGSAAADPGSALVPASALQACAGIGASAERLACYDRLAGRVAPSQREATTRAAAPPLSGAAAAQAVSGAAAAPSAAPQPNESFGLYHAEHPAAPPPAQSLTARVVGLHLSANGHATVQFEGGEVWELDDPDPVLAPGDSVTITRAAFGSFLLTTPSRRTHRVHRVR
jgi:hypothetical protein